MATAAAPAPQPPPEPQAQQPQDDQQQRALAWNAMRLKAIGDRIMAHMDGRAALPTNEFPQLVYALARGIDFAVSARDIPPVAGDIPGILRKLPHIRYLLFHQFPSQGAIWRILGLLVLSSNFDSMLPELLNKCPVYELRKETFIQSSLMVLVISCKNACSSNWFPSAADSKDILSMANEFSGNFCTSSGQVASDSNVLEIISQIMPRYYPRLKFERLIISMEAKVGYDILMADFFIERNLPRDEKIRLIIVQKENLDASTCVTSPPHVSFLVNGKAVDKRTNVSMEPGPQFPTDITKMLKYGANIIQAAGYFNANYIIAVAFVNNLTSFSAPKLDDYAQPKTVYPADTDVLEGPSRVSLNCPISFKRIKTPIKGRLCKHYQCFDYDNYMEMNSRKPNWRCPLCNTPSNFTDLRIDQKMAKILEENGNDVIDVLVFADGSWKAAPAHDEKSDRHRGDAVQQNGDTIETDSPSSGVIDLINGNGDGDLPMDWTSTSEDTKPQLISQDLSVSDYLPDFPMADQTEDQYLGDGSNGGSNMAVTSRQNLLLPSTSGLGTSSFGTLESILPQNVLRPIITDAVSPSLETSSSTSSMQHFSQEPHCETLQLQPQIGPVLGSEVRRIPIPRNPRREPVGVQALPMPPQNPGTSTMLQPNILNCPPPIPLSTPASSTYQGHQVTNPDCAPMNNGCGLLPRIPSVAASSHLQSTRDMRNTSSHQPSRVVSLPAPHLMGARPSPGQAGGVNTYRPTPMQQTPTVDPLRHTRMTMNQTALAAVGQTSAAAHVQPTQADVQSRHFPRLQIQVPRSQAVPRAATPPSLQRTPPHLQPSSVPSAAPSIHPPSLQRAPPHLQPPSIPPAAPSTPQAGSSDGLPPDLPVDENWCPTGQMRGSLTGSAYNSAIRRYLGPNEQQQGQARPPSASGARRPH